MAACEDWTTGDDAAGCGCSVVGSDTSQLDEAVAAATDLLYMESGQQYPGECEQTVRPCATGGCGLQFLDPGHLTPSVFGWMGFGWWADGRAACGCSHESKILLAGAPVRSITEVKIDGVIVDPTGYELVDQRWLIRLADTEGNPRSWPSCQRMDIPAGEPGTWTVKYKYGAAPPISGVLAARELACQIYLQCTEDDDCQLPSGATTITRLGVTVQREFFTSWGRDPQTGAWRTGLALVDAFLNAHNPNGLRRRPAIASPDSRRYPRSLGA